MWLASEEDVTVEVLDPTGAARTVSLVREPSETWGFEFADAVFDTVRTCANRCTFCFVAQLPSGLRPALYVRDDDYRLSFLQGNFITLTNLSPGDVERIAEMALTPLYVSLHAVDPDVRSQLVCARDDVALARFDELLESGIELHVQIVLLPGVNDSDVLDRTLTWLAEREGVLSVGIVPLGYTRFQESFDASFQDPTAALRVIAQVKPWQDAMRERDGATWVHLADEFYLNARAPFPPTEHYDDFPQYENGIGIARAFVDEVTALKTEIQSALLALPAEEESVTLVTSMMAATTMAGALNACDAAGRARLLVVPNAFFGGNVSVTGLLTGHDIVAAIEHDDHPGTYVLPDVIFNADGVTLDDLALSTVEERTGARVRVVSSDAAGLVDALRG